MKSRMSVLALTALCTGVTGAALAQGMPKLKPGLWESVSKADNAPAPTSMQICVDEKFDISQLMKVGQGMVQGMCKFSEPSFSGNKGTNSAECKFGGSSMKSVSTTTFNSDTSYRTESKATFEPPIYGMKGSNTVVDAKHLGPCKAGMKTGDMIVNGQTVNVLEATKRAQSK
jgi:hypothetical protein